MTARAPSARVCAICGRPKGTIPSTLHLKWLRERSPESVPFAGDYMHLSCFRATDSLLARKVQP